MPLSKTQEAEVRKAFHMVDRDGSGSIDINELRNVVRSVLNEEPSDERMQELFKLIDADNSGTIELQEFLDALSNWFGETGEEVEDAEDTMMTGDGVGSKRKRNDDDDREHTHKRIKSFFSQIKPEALGEELQKEVEAYHRMRNLGAVSHDFLSEHGGTVDSSAQKKVDAIKITRESLTKQEQILHAISHGDVNKKILAVEEVNKMLSICEAFPTPSERSPVAPLLMQVFTFLLKNKEIIETIIQGLATNNIPLQMVAVRALTLFVPGPRLASLPRNNIMHTSQAICKRVCIVAGIVNVLMNILRDSPSMELKLKVVECIGAIASNNFETRDLLLQNGALAALASMVGPRTSDVAHRKISWAMGRLFGISHKRLPSYDLLVPAFEHVAWMLSSIEDAQVVVNCCRMLELVLPGASDDAISSRVIDLLKITDKPAIVRAALDLVAAVAFWGQEDNCEPFYHYGLFTLIPALIEHDSAEVRVSCIDMLCALVEKRHRTTDVIDSLPADKLKRYLDMEQSNARFAKLLMLVTMPGSHQLTSQHVAYLVKHKIIDVISSHLRDFKEYDSVLVEQYNFLGASFNTELVLNLLLCLRHILIVGRQDARDVRVNEYALKIDLNAVDKLTSLLDTIAKTDEDELNAWRVGDNASIEDHIRDILGEAKRAHDTQLDVASSNRVSEMIKHAEAKYSHVIWIKLHYEDEPSRVIRFEGEITFEKLGRTLGSCHDKPVVAFYKDSTDELLPLDTEDSFIHAKKGYEHHHRSYLDLFIRPADGSLPRPPSLVEINRPLKVSSSSFEISERDRFYATDQMSVFDELSRTAKFSAEDLGKLRDFWVELSGGNPLISREQFQHGLTEINPGMANNPLLMEQLYCVADRDNSGSIDLREFMTCLSKMLGSTDDRLQLMFSAYDLDKSNSLSRSEVYLMIKSCSSRTYRDDVEIQELVNRIFDLVDTNNDGELSYEEFSRGYKEGNIAIAIE